MRFSSVVLLATFAFASCANAFSTVGESQQVNVVASSNAAQLAEQIDSNAPKRLLRKVATQEDGDDDEDEERLWEKIRAYADEIKKYLRHTDYYNWVRQGKTEEQVRKTMGLSEEAAKTNPEFQEFVKSSPGYEKFVEKWG